MNEARTHSEYGGSSASRWMNCIGSTVLCRTVPERTTSAAAAEGTLAHAFAEHFLREGTRDAKQFTGMTLTAEVETKPMTEAMAGYINIYLDAVYAELDAAPDAELYVEQSFTLHIDSAPHGSVFGTNDAIVYTPSRRRLAVFDLKYGAGVSVKSEDNAQLKFYAAGAALSNADWLVSEVELYIVQPRAFDIASAGDVRPWSMPVLDLLDFPADVESAIALAEFEAELFTKGVPVADLKLTAGSWCRFCPAAPACPAAANKALTLAAVDFKDVTQATSKNLPLAETIDPVRIGQILHAQSILEAWFASVEKFAMEAAERGVPIPGWKLVDKQARRKYLGNEDEAAAFLMVSLDAGEDEVTPRKLLGITDADRLIRSKISDKALAKKTTEDYALKYTIKESSGHTLVPASDKRPAVGAVTTDFNAVALPAAD